MTELSYWHKRHPSLQKNHYQFLIVGQGITGLSLAYWLSKAWPKAKIAIIDKFSLGYGASGRNVGFVTSGSATYFNILYKKFGAKHACEIWNYAKTNFQLLKEEINNHLEGAEFLEKGSLTVAKTDEDKKKLQEISLLLKENNCPHEFLQGKDLRSYINSPIFDSGILLQQEASLNPQKLLLILKSKLPNADFFDGTEVFDFKENAGVVNFKTNKGDFLGEKGFLCLNAFTSKLLPNMQELIKPVRAQVLSIQCHKQLLTGNFYFSPDKVYFRQTSDNSILVGGFRHLEEENEIGFELHTTPLIQKALEEFIKEALPEIKDLPVGERWAGTMGFSQRELPFCQRLPGQKEVYFLGGYSGHGLGYSFLLAKELVDIIQGKRVNSTFDLILNAGIKGVFYPCEG